MKSMRLMKGVKLRFSSTVLIICLIALTGLLFTEDLRALTEEMESFLEEGSREDEKVGVDFDRQNCSVVDGMWVFDRTIEPLYSDTNCPYLDDQVACRKNGRPDDGYLYWQWQLDECVLPRFDAADVLEKLRGKRLMFVGDSLQRGQWQSFVCLVQSHLAPDQKSVDRGEFLSVFRALEYNATVEFYWAPFLVESNSDMPILFDANQRIIRVDSINKHAQNWIGVDILVFNTYVWWMSGLKIKSLWGSFSNGEKGFEEFDATISYKIAVKTWANWMDSNIDPNKTRVFFTTMSPTHMRSEDWHQKGIRCFNETVPVTKRGHWGTGSNMDIMRVVKSVIGKMTIPVTFLNVTQLSEYRIDAHTSVYTESMGKVYTEKEWANPQQYADCIHWCLPGLPDTWNQVLYAYL